ncbi:MAG: Amt family ammonium transporter, partial [Kiritimatiellia bacterium]
MFQLRWLFSTQSVVLFALLFPSLANAQTLDGANTAWILTATALVLFMTLPGLALFYAGLVRSKNVLSILMQCFAIACVASLIWLAVGYSLSFSGDGAFIGNLNKAFLAGITEDSLSGDIPEILFVMF